MCRWADDALLLICNCRLIHLWTSKLEVLRQCMFLVVPDSQYNAKVPVLIVTDILNHLLEVTQSEHGSRFLQDAHLHTSWYLAFRCLTLMEKQLQRNRSRLASMKSAESSRIIIPPNGRVVIHAYLDRKIPYHRVLAMLHPTHKSCIPTDLNITPFLHYYYFEV